MFSEDVPNIHIIPHVLSQSNWQSSTEKWEFAFSSLESGQGFATKCSDQQSVKEVTLCVL